MNMLSFYLNITVLLRKMTIYSTKWSNFPSLIGTNRDLMVVHLFFSTTKNKSSFGPILGSISFFTKVHNRRESALNGGLKHYFLFLGHKSALLWTTTKIFRRAVIFLIRRQFQQLRNLFSTRYTTFTNRRAFLLFFNLFWDISSTNTVISYCKSLIFPCIYTHLPCYIGSRACIYRTNTCTNT